MLHYLIQTCKSVHFLQIKYRCLLMAGQKFDIGTKLVILDGQKMTF